MHPVLFELPWGGHANAYGTLILIGALATMPGLWWDLTQRKIATGDRLSFFVDNYLAIALGAFVGGRILHVLTVPDAYVADPSRVFVSDGTGFVFFGSLLAIVLSWFWLARRHHTRFAILADLTATWMPLGHAFGRLGCYFAGCCWGAPTDAAWAVSFPAESIVAVSGGAPMHGDHTVGLVPIQLIEALGLFTIAAGLALLRVRRGIEPIWRQTGRYALAYGLLRLCTEVFRGDPTRGFVIHLAFAPLAVALGLPPDSPVALSSGQAVALGLIVLGVLGVRRPNA